MAMITSSRAQQQIKFHRNPLMWDPCFATESELIPPSPIQPLCADVLSNIIALICGWEDVLPVLRFYNVNFCGSQAHVLLKGKALGPGVGLRVHWGRYNVALRPQRG